MSSPTDRTGGKTRRNLFRKNALERYCGPLQSDIPDTLLPWRPVLPLAAVAMLLAVSALWFFP